MLLLLEMPPSGNIPSMSGPLISHNLPLTDAVGNLFELTSCIEETIVAVYVNIPNLETCSLAQLSLQSIHILCSLLYRKPGRLPNTSERATKTAFCTYSVKITHRFFKGQVMLGSLIRCISFLQVFMHYT